MFLGYFVLLHFELVYFPLSPWPLPAGPQNPASWGTHPLRMAPWAGTPPIAWLSLGSSSRVCSVLWICSAHLAASDLEGSSCRIRGLTCGARASCHAGQQVQGDPCRCEGTAVRAGRGQCEHCRWPAQALPQSRHARNHSPGQWGQEDVGANQGRGRPGARLLRIRATQERANRSWGRRAGYNGCAMEATRKPVTPCVRVCVCVCACVCLRLCVIVCVCVDSAAGGVPLAPAWWPAPSTPCRAGTQGVGPLGAFLSLSGHCCPCPHTPRHGSVCVCRQPRGCPCPCRSLSQRWN